MEDQTEQKMKERFAYLNKVQAEARAEQERIKAIYGPILEAERKESVEAVRTAAEEERHQHAKQLDPLELIKQVQKMREEGFDAITVREAFNEVMGEKNGLFRRPLRRIVKTEDMTPTMTQEAINAMYVKRLKGEDKTAQQIADILTSDMEAIVDEVRRGQRARLSKKPTITMIGYTAAFYLLKYPVKALLYILQTPERRRINAWHKKNGVYSDRIGNFGMDDND